MAKKGILSEAIAEAKALKEAAIRNAENSLVGHFRGSLEEVVNEQLNEEFDMDAGDEQEEDEMNETLEFDPGEMAYMSEMDDMDDLELEEEDDDLELEDEDGFEDEDDLDDLDMEEDEDMALEGMAGFTEADLREALDEVLAEVDHGDLGEPEDVTPDVHSTGLMDDDGKETGWEEKRAPHARDWTVKESAYRSKIARLVVENKSLQKGMAKLREAVEQIQLFNRKLYYAHKLLNKKGLNESLEVKIVTKLDGAKTAKEAQNIYESFEAVLGLISESAKPKKKAPTLSEALGSQGRKERGVSHVDDAHLLSEDAKYSVSRMQFLAGLRKED